MTRESIAKTFNDNVHYLYSAFSHQTLEDSLDYTIASSPKWIYVGTILEEGNDIIRFDHKLKEKERQSVDGEVTVIVCDGDGLYVGTSTGKVYQGEFDSLTLVHTFDSEITSICKYSEGLIIGTTANLIFYKAEEILKSIHIETVAVGIYKDLVLVLDTSTDANVVVYKGESLEKLYTINLVGEGKSLAIHHKYPYMLVGTDKLVQLYDLTCGVLASWEASEEEHFERLKWNAFIDTQFLLSCNNQIHLIDIVKIDSEFVDEDCDYGPEFISTHVTLQNNISDFSIFKVRGKEKFGVVAVDSEQMQRYILHPELIE